MYNFPRISWQSTCNCGWLPIRHFSQLFFRPTLPQDNQLSSLETYNIHYWRKTEELLTYSPSDFCPIFADVFQESAAALHSSFFPSTKRQFSPANNVNGSIYNKSLMGTPYRVEVFAVHNGWDSSQSGFELWISKVTRNSGSAGSKLWEREIHSVQLWR